MEFVVSESEHSSAGVESIVDDGGNNSLCLPCEALLEAVILEDFENSDVWQSTKKSWVRHHFRSHYHYLGAIRQSALVCEMCELIIDNWTQCEEEEDSTEYWIFAEPVLSGATSCPLSFLISTEFDEDDEEGQRFELFHKQGLDALDVNEIEEDGAGRPKWPSLVRTFGSRKYNRMRSEVSTYSGSDECFALASKWLTECMSTHEACTRTEEKYVPKRLLDTAAGPSNDGLRLCESPVTHQPFVALSHCWGGKVSLRTTKANKASHLRRISLYNMPHTFRDAVSIVRKLGFRYLWIDALCIVQDSEADWQQEASVMDKVYSSAALTISCAASANSRSGIFSQRKRRWSIPVQTSSLSSLRLHDLHLSALEVPDDVYEDLEHSHLNSRAWILQERILSHANLHFTDQALVWECRSHTRTEDGHSSSCHPLFKNIANYRTPTAGDTFVLWYILVEDYTRRKLTYESDKLTALAGLAAYFSNIHGVKGYYYGLWGPDLPRGLLWGRHLSLETIANGFPSWSWASRRHQVSYHMGIFNEGPVIIPGFDVHIHGLGEQLEVEGLLLETFCDSRNQYIGREEFAKDLDFWMDNLNFTGRCCCLYVSIWGISKAELRAEFLVLEEKLLHHRKFYKRIGTASYPLKEAGVIEFKEKFRTIIKDQPRVRLILI